VPVITLRSTYKSSLIPTLEQIYEDMDMWWECSECGGHVERSRAPVSCRECGTAGVIFVPVDINDPLVGTPEAGSLRAVWLRAGLEQGRSRLVA
jgi:hypothetical protein